MRVARMGVEHHAAVHRAFGPRRGCAIASTCTASCATFYWLNTHVLAQSFILLFRSPKVLLLFVAAG